MKRNAWGSTSGSWNHVTSRLKPEAAYQRLLKVKHVFMSQQALQLLLAMLHGALTVINGAQVMINGGPGERPLQNPPACTLLLLDLEHVQQLSQVLGHNELFDCMLPLVVVLEHKYVISTPIDKQCLVPSAIRDMQQTLQSACWLT